MRHALLPPTLHADEPTPHVDWNSGAVRLLTEPVPWEDPGRPRRAGVSSFGISGTNAHLILEEAPAEDAAASAETAVPVPWVLSARSETALRAQAARLHDHLAGGPVTAAADVGRSLATSRTAFEHRAVVLGSTAGDLMDALAGLAAGEISPDVVRGSAGPGRTAFLFSGQGSQRPGMGRELHEAHPVFAAALDEAAACLDPHLERPVKEVMFAADGPIDETCHAQAALFAFETALYRLFASWGLRPDLVIGHSVGELAAAHVAGVLDLPDAARLVAARGRLMQAARTDGAMVSLRAAADDIAPELPPGVSIAAVNGPDSTVVSGDAGPVAAFAREWRERGHRAKRLRVSHAFHSPHMDPILEEFREAARGVRFHAPSIPLVSNLTGRIADPGDLRSPDYWTRHIRETVRFHDGVRTLAAEGVTTAIEIGPDAVLTPMAQPTLPEGACVPAVRRDRPDRRAVMLALATAFTRGVRPDWGRVYAGARLVDLPTYAFQRRRYWLDAAEGAATGAQAAFWEAVRTSDIAWLTDALDLPADRKDALAGLLPVLAGWWDRHRPVPPALPFAEADASPAPDAEAAAEFRDRLAGETEPAGRARVVAELVRTHAAAVLGLGPDAEVADDQEFLALGFSSLTALELRNRLCAVTGLRLDPVAAFDHPTPALLADHLLDALSAG
ncbi:type I polyketide synthase, partial [Spirillospora sp. NPDC048832]